MAGSSSNEVGLGSCYNAQLGEGVDLLQPLQPASRHSLTQTQHATELFTTRVVSSCIMVIKVPIGSKHSTAHSPVLCESPSCFMANNVATAIGSI